MTHDTGTHTRTTNALSAATAAAARLAPAARANRRYAPLTLTLGLLALFTWTTAQCLAVTHTPDPTGRQITDAQGNALLLVLGLAIVVGTLATVTGLRRLHARDSGRTNRTSITRATVGTMFVTAGLLAVTAGPSTDTPANTVGVYTTAISAAFALLVLRDLVHITRRLATRRSA